MNSVSYPPSAHLSTARKRCHPERSLGMSEANCQTESKDLYHPNPARGTEANFRVVVRFFDEHEGEHHPAVSREAAAWESPARQCRGCVVDGTSPEGTALSHKRITQ
jgi:hypothetical protein